MNRRPIIFGFALLLFLAVLAGIFFSFFSPMQTQENTLSPQMQTQRLTSVFLLRKIERLRDEAVYLQHKEEGRKLLELAGRGTKDEKTSTGSLLRSASEGQAGEITIPTPASSVSVPLTQGSGTTR